MKKADLPKTSDPVNLVKPLLPRNLFSHCLLFNRITQPNCSKYTHACLTKLYESFCFSLFEVSRPRRGKIFFERRGRDFRFSTLRRPSSFLRLEFFFHFRNNRNCDIFSVLSEKNSSKYRNGTFHRIIGFESKEVRFSESGTCGTARYEAGSIGTRSGFGRGRPVSPKKRVASAFQQLKYCVWKGEKKPSRGGSRYRTTILPAFAFPRRRPRFREKMRAPVVTSLD